jgi:antagonist of KipI
MSILLRKSGILTTVQDLGRNGFRHLGINPNGAMDKTAVRLINVLLGNSENEAVLEMHFPAPEIVFNEAAFFALGGADFAPELDGKLIENWQIHFAEKGSTLKFGEKKFGNRVYLAIRNGFKIEKTLTSSSTNLIAKFGGFEGRKLQNGDEIEFNSAFQIAQFASKAKISNSLIPFYSRFPTVRIVAGAEFENLTALSEQNFLKTDFAISQDSNRMGFRLQGKPIHLLNQKELVSSAVNFGTIQLLPDGQMIILMADHQISGGYPRIANIISQDLPLVAQLGANDKIAFHLISIEDAENLLLDFERELNLLKIGVKFPQKT